MSKIAIIGAGNMGGAIARGLIKGEMFLPSDIAISDVSEKTLEQLRNINTDWTLSSSNAAIIQDADIIVLAVKPWLVEDIADEMLPDEIK